MSETKDGGPAYPVRIGSQHDQYLASTGMSIRDYFAAAALMHEYTRHDSDPHKIAEWAFQVADAMLKARESSHD